MSLDDVEVVGCTRHPRTLTAVRCSKCETPICPRCMIQTPVGARCRECAQLRRLPQFEVSPWLLARSTAGGLIVSIVAWALLSGIAFLRFFLAILVGVAVGEVMSRLNRRRTSLAIEVAAVVVIVLGFALVEVFLTGGGIRSLLTALGQSPSFVISLLIPVVIAGFVAVVKLR